MRDVRFPLFLKCISYRFDPFAPTFFDDINFHILRIYTCIYNTENIFHFLPYGDLHHRKVGSVQSVEFRTVRIDTGALSVSEKFARGPREPGPELLNSAKVT